MRARRFHLSWNQMRHTVRIASQRRIVDLVALGLVAGALADRTECTADGPASSGKRVAVRVGVGR